MRGDCSQNLAHLRPHSVPNLTTFHCQLLAPASIRTASIRISAPFGTSSHKPSVGVLTIVIYSSKLRFGGLLRVILQFVCHGSPSVPGLVEKLAVTFPYQSRRVLFFVLVR